MMGLGGVVGFISKQYWMADENCKECYDCKTVSRTLSLSLTGV